METETGDGIMGRKTNGVNPFINPQREGGGIREGMIPEGIDSIDHNEREKLIYDKDDDVALAFPQNTHITHRRAARDEGVYTYMTSEKKGGRLRNTPNAPNLQKRLRTNRRRQGLKIKKILWSSYMVNPQPER